MSVEENKAIVRRFLEGIFKTPEILDEVCTTNFILHWRDETPVSGLDQLKKEFVVWHNDCFGICVFEIEDMIAENDKVAARLIQIGTHAGMWADAAPTGKRWRVREYIFFRMQDGKIAELWTVVDEDDRKEQLGFRSLPPEV